LCGANPLMTGLQMLLQMLLLMLLLRLLVTVLLMLRLLADSLRLSPCSAGCSPYVPASNPPTVPQDIDPPPNLRLPLSLSFCLSLHAHLRLIRP
jgi:hypothetical protein